MVKKNLAAAATKKPVSLRTYLNDKTDGHTLTTLARASGVSYSAIYRHVREGRDLSARNARKLEKWSKGYISLAMTMSEPVTVQRVVLG